MNRVSIGLAIVFLIPVLMGMYRPFSREKILYSLQGMFDNVFLFITLLLSVYLVKVTFIEHKLKLFKYLYNIIPSGYQHFFDKKDMLCYLVNVPLLFLIISIGLKPLIYYLYRYTLVPASLSLNRVFERMNYVLRAVLGALFQIPKALLLVLISSFLLLFYTYNFSAPNISKWMGDSGVYQFVYNKALVPVLNSGVAKKIPVLINNSFAQALGENADINSNAAREFAKRLTKGKLVIEYFNGVTLDEAIKSNDEIDGLAVKKTGGLSGSRKKALAIYDWVSSNIVYDYNKAKNISVNSRGISSGAVSAFATRKGICFDYSCLYIAMCRAAGLKVRLVTGLAFSGISWGDHAWNQVFIPEENRWINVDSTFGAVGDYFDNRGFENDHRYPEIQGEW